MTSGFKPVNKILAEMAQLLAGNVACSATTTAGFQPTYNCRATWQVASLPPGGEPISHQGASLHSAKHTVMDLSRLTYRLLATAVLLLMFALALSSMAQKAPTFDEQGFIVRGLAYLRGHTQIRVGHPLGLNALNASLMVGDETVALPIDDPSWSGTSFHRPAELFLWEIGNNVEHVMFLARLPTIWLGLLMAALAGRWAAQLSGRRWAGLLALLFVALDPNVLAHARLATTDLGLAAFSLLAGYTLWRFMKQPSWGRALLAGAAMGLLQNTKFTAMLFIPLFALVMLIWLLVEWRENARAPGRSFLGAIPWRSLLMILVVYPLAALAILWAANGFDIGTLPADLPMMQSLSGTTLPLADHLEQLLDIGGRLRVGTPSFLLGNYSDGGWWYYFPVAFLLKTPLSTLILLTWGAVVYLLCILRRKQACPSLLDSAALLVPALGYFAIALTTDINLGYRHILPLLPSLIIFAAVAVSRSVRPETAVRLAPVAALAGWLALANLLIYPDYLAYFNLLAGGADDGWHSLVDSNLDWGQDLDDLAPWMAENGVGEVWLSYFGEAHPEYYGVNYRGLDSFPPRLMNPQTRSYYAANPAPGVYAISATNLQGVHFSDRDQFATFREREPVDKLGHSIFLFEVPATGEQVDLILAGMQMDHLPPAASEHLGTNDVRLRWVDPQQSLIVPAGDQAWLAYPSGQDFHPALASFLQGSLGDMSRDDGFELASYNARPFQDSELAFFSAEAGLASLEHVQVMESDSSSIVLQTAWQQNGPAQPVQIFVHALAEDGRIVAQWDGLGAAWEGWHEGDTLLQMHELSLPEAESMTEVRLVTGLYNPQTDSRWQTESGADHFEIPLGG